MYLGYLFESVCGFYVNIYIYIKKVNRYLVCLFFGIVKFCYYEILSGKYIFFWIINKLIKKKFIYS